MWRQRSSFFIVSSKCSGKQFKIQSRSPSKHLYMSYSKQISKAQYLRHFCARLSIDTNNLWTSFFTYGVEQIIAMKPAHRWKPLFSHSTDYNKHNTSFNFLIYSHSLQIFMAVRWQAMMCASLFFPAYDSHTVQSKIKMMSGVRSIISLNSCMKHGSNSQRHFMTHTS